MARRKRMQIEVDNGTTILSLGEMEIWDGADLALLRETLSRLVDVEQCRSICVDMTYVKYIPSGFFGMLFDWHERGVDMQLADPQAHVMRMLWFRQFFEATDNNRHRLLSEAKQPLVTEGQRNGWNSNVPWKTAESPERNTAEAPERTEKSVPAPAATSE